MKTRVAFATVAFATVLASLAPGALHAQDDLLEAEILGHHGSPPRHVRLESRGGLDLELMENGQRFGYPVIFLHSLADSWYSFARVLPQLPLEVRAYYYSQRGHGGSDQPACCYTQADYVADLLALMDVKGIQKATLVGHGMGAYTAHQFAVEHPERVDGLVLVAATEKAGNTPLGDFDITLQSQEQISRAFVEGYQASLLCGSIGDNFFNKVVDESLKVPLHVWQDALHELVLEDHSEQLATLDMPTLVVGGMGDSMFSAENQLLLAEKIPSASIVLYANICHAPQWSNPVTFAEDLVQFLRRDVWHGELPPAP